MRTPAIALLWELWRKNRWGHITLLAAIPVCGLLCGLEAHLRGGQLLPEFVPPALLPMIISIIWLFSVFGFTESDSRRGFTGIPLRIFALPLRTITIVTWLTVSGVLAVCGLYLAWAELVFAPAGFPLPILFPTAVLATSIVFFQAAVWGLASFPLIRAVVLIGGAVALIWVNAVGLSDDDLWSQSDVSKSLWVLAFLPLAYGAAVFGVQAERCGGWHVWAWLRAITRPLLRIIPRRKTAFNSRAGAQLWFEWRRKGWFLAIAIGCSLTVVVVLSPVAVLSEPHAPFSLVVLLHILFFPLFMSGVAGLGLGKPDFWSRETGLTAYQAVQPITSADLVFTKLKIAGLITLLGGLVGLTLTWGVTRSSSWRELWNMAELTPKFTQLLSVHAFHPALVAAVSSVAVMIIIWHSMTSSLSFALIGRLRTINTRAIVRGVLLFEVIWLIKWLSDHPGQLREFTPLVYAASGLVIAWKITRAARAFREVIHRKLVSHRAACGLMGLSLIAAASIFVLGWIFGAQIAAPLLVFGAVWLFPGGALAQSVLNLVSNRHR